MKIVSSFRHAFSPTILVFISLLITTSCKVSLIPDYSAALAQDIFATAKKVDDFYLTMQEKPADARKYEQFSDTYIDIQADLNGLMARNKVRPLNNQSTRITELTIQLWEKYKAEHKTDDKISDGEIKLNRKTFSDMFYAMHVAEEAKNIPGNTNP